MEAVLHAVVRSTVTPVVQIQNVGKRLIYWVTKVLQEINYNFLASSDDKMDIFVIRCTLKHH